MAGKAHASRMSEIEQHKNTLIRHLALEVASLFLIVPSIICRYGITFYYKPKSSQYILNSKHTELSFLGSHSVTAAHVAG